MRGHDLSYVAHSGLLGALSADIPWHPALPLALQAGALSAVVAIQAALLRRAQTGEGGFIDLSLSEAAGWFLTCGINPLSEQPLHLPASPDRRLYACADGRFVAVACAEPRSWGVLCDQLGVPELKPNLWQAEPAAATAKVLADIFVTRSAAEWVERLTPSGAAVTIFNHAAQLLEDPHIRARGSVVEVGGVPVPASPIRFTAGNGATTRTATEAPHRVGDDTAEILGWAGLSAGEIDTLTQDKVI